MKAKSGPTTVLFRMFAILMIAMLMIAALPTSKAGAAVTPTVVTFTTSGSWVAPAGVTSVTAEVWGGGGRGGSRTSSGRGGGGGGGAYATKLNIPVTPGTSYSYVVGSGSSSGTAAGGDSYFINAATVMAKGGSSVTDNNSNGGAGGSALTSVGDTVYAGGTGANAGTSYGGGGGSSAGTAAAGVNATNQNGAVAPAGGGNGGNGRANSAGDGSAGITPGGGGGGAYRSFGGGTMDGGNGARGQVRLTFTLPPTTTIGDGTSPSAKFAKGSETNLAVSTFTLSANSDDTVTNVTVTGSGSGLADITAVTIWKDNGTANEYDGADVSMGSGTFSGLTADISVSIPVTSTSTQYLITYSVAASPTNTNTAQAIVSAITGTNTTVVNNDTTDATLTFDTVAPTIAIGVPSKTITNIGPVTYTITYADTNFNASTLVPANVSLNSTGGATGTVAVTGTGLTRTVTISSISGNGTLGISIAAGTASDKAGNLAPTVGPSDTFTVDNIGPTVVSINRVDPDPSIAAAVNWTVIFSKPVINVGTNDFALAVTGGITGQSITAVTPVDASTYTVTANTGSGSGTLGLNIAATPTITDSAGNAVATGFVGQFYTFNRSLTISGTLTAVGANATIACFATTGTCPVGPILADATGAYSIQVTGTGTPSAFSGIIEPIPPSGYTFSPQTRTYTLITADQPAQNYTPHVVTNTTYYVDNTVTCSASGGTIALPFCTISQAANVAVAGNTVRVLAGTYAETVKPKSGNPDAPVTFLAGPGAVTITGEAGNSTNGGGFRLNLKHDIVIDGFAITGPADYGVYAYHSTRLTIRNNHISYAGTAGVTTKVGIELDNVTNSTVSGNTVDHNTYHGIRFWNTSTNNTVSNNTVFGNATQTNSRATGIDFEIASSNNTVIHNTTYANEDSGLQFYSGSIYNTVVGNLTYGNGDHGIDNNASPHNTIIGNTVHGNVTAGINLEGSPTGSDYGVVMGNIAVNNGLLRQLPSGHITASQGNIRVDSQSYQHTTMDYNLYFVDQADPHYQIVWDGSNYNSLLTFQAATPEEDHGLEGDPLFISPAAIAARPSAAPYNVAINVGNYHISTYTSLAVDSGYSSAPQTTTDLDGFDRVDDTTVANTGGPSAPAFYDRGAYEYQPVITTVTSDLNPATYGDAVVFTATVNKDDATGTVNFYIDGALVGTGTLTGTGSPNTATYNATHLNAKASPYSVTATYLGGGGYPGSTSAPYLQTVNPYPITITPNTGQTKVYGTTDPTFAYTPSATPDVAFTGTLGRDPGENVGTYAYLMDTLSAGSNYTLTLASGRTFAITAKPISITPDNGQFKIYNDPDPVFTFTPSETPDVAFTGALGRAAGENVNTYAYTLDTLSAGGNYTLTLVPGRTFEIRAKAITITPDLDQSKLYGEADPVFTYVPSPALKVGDSLTGVLGREEGENVGTYDYTLGTLSGAPNYTLTLGGARTFEIEQKPVVITPESGQSKVYGTADPTFAFTPSVVPDVPSTGDLSRDLGEDVNTYAFHLNTLSYGPNYILSLAPGVTFAITPKPVTITPRTGQSKVFGSADPVYTYDPSPALIVGDSLTGGLSRDPGEDVATYAFTMGSLSGGANYNLTLAGGRTFAITPKPVTVTVNSGQTKVYGTADPVFTYVPSESISFTGVLSREPGEDVGLYAITQGTLSAGANYAINFVSANFSITKASQTITFGALANKVLGAPDFAVTATASSGLPVSFSSATPSVCDFTAGGLVNLITAGTCTINADQLGDSNYFAAQRVQRSFDVTLGDSTVVLTSSDNPAFYGDTINFTVTATLGATGTVNIYDGVTLIGTATLTGATPNKAVFSTSDLSVAASPHSITAHYLGDATHAGSTSTAVVQVVNKAPLSVTANDASKVYDGVAYSGGNGVTYSGFVNGETSAVVTGTPVYAGDSQGAINVGSYTISVSGLTAANYTITYHTGTLTISQAPQTITFTSTPPSYGIVGDTYTPTATATSGQTVIFTIDAGSASVCSIANGVVTFNSNGTCTINANQPGNASYSAAPQVQQSIVVGIYKLFLPIIFR